ncbi:hypothetical protein VE25_03400 [Devosia geojensis]|uniref:Probable membrane transporter protein n=1 Tax=Devosia geojensis TaxID=443610 RepID=A0A0F5FW89_9HYPH|nr:sulfite exporter TauE/SafE family protein [Devosia geojensis]KKB13141.1 hypothetical protein VE25_03400 [Devosia geojensis]
MPILATLGMIFAVFVTSTLSGIFGMAGGMILLWLLLLVMPVAAAIAVQGMIQLIANGSRAWMTRAYIDWRVLAIMLVGLAAAALILFFIRYQPDLATVTIVVGLLPILVWIPKSWLALDAGKPHHALLCGFLGGGLNLTVGVAGPTVDIFFIRTEMDRRAIIATKAAMQVLSHLTKIIFYAGATLTLAQSEWITLAIAAPFAVLGTKAGNIVLEKMTDVHFRAWTRIIVTCIGLVFLARGIALLA